jgi:hypothetical protein
MRNAGWLTLFTMTRVLATLSGGTMPIHVLWQKTWHHQPKVRVTVNELVRLATSERSVFNPSGEL